MSTTKSDISGWFDEGVEMSASHMLVVCDTFSYEDYPVYISPPENAEKIAIEHYGYPDAKNMQRVMECYDLGMDKQEQLAERRAFHW